MPDDDVEQFQVDEQKRAQRILASHASQLAEHFSSVQIICTSVNPQDGTRIYVEGRGDCYARIGAADFWVRQQKK